MVAGLNYPAGSGGPPPGGGAFTLTSAPEGGWTLPQHPIATYYNGYTYFAWVNGSTGAIKIASYKHSDGSVSAAIQLDSAGGDVDDHNNPAILVRDSDHKLLVAFCLHGGPNMFLFVSTTSLDTDPTLADGFAAAVNLDSSIGASNYTYPELFQLTGIANDPIYLVYRDFSSPDWRLAYSKSSDGGATWSARTLLMVGSTTNSSPYWQSRATTTRIDFLTTDREYHGNAGPVDLGHMYLDGTDDKVYQSDGTEITASKPFAHSELTQLETDVAGAFVMDGIAGTNPVFTYGLENGDGTVTGIYARWDGAAWDKGTIYTEDELSLDWGFGGIAINRTDPEEVAAGIATGASTSEMVVYASADLGLTWDAGTPVTSGSGDWNVAVVPVANADASLPYIWLRGTFTTSANFSFGIRGLAG